MYHTFRVYGSRSAEKLLSQWEGCALRIGAVRCIMGSILDIGVGIMAIEYERKLATTPEEQELVRISLMGQWKLYNMKTTYYDTPEGSLSARKWMLRHRLENQTHVCALKTPAGEARNEWEVTAERIEDAIERLIDLGAPQELRQLVKSGLVAVCGAEFTRLTDIVYHEMGAVEISFDKGFLFAGERQEPLCEMELELKSGCKRPLDDYVTILQDVLGLQELTESKYKRARKLKDN